MKVLAVLWMTLALAALIEGQSEEDIMESLVEEIGEEGQVAPDIHFCEAADAGYVQPNIVFVLADDLGFNDVSWNNPDVVSPTLQDLADTGIILDRNYVAPVCSPTRGSLMTGKYTYRIGMQHGVIAPDYPECLGLDEVTLATEMKELGYATHYVGKWHLGFCNEACLPTSRGFDSYYGFYNGYVDHYNHEISGGYDWWDNGVADVDNNGTYASELITERAVKIINEHDASSPLYLFISQALVHTPIQVAPDMEASTDADAEAALRADYLSMVTSLDDSVADIMAALKDTGLYDNTVFVFSSDNGGEHGPSSNYPLRGEKATLFEGGTRVPGLVHSPLQTETGIRHTGTMYVTDWFSTFVHLGGGCIHEALDLDSLDQRDLILNGGDSIRHEYIYNMDNVIPQPFGMAAFRMGDFKMIFGYPGLYDGWEQDGNLDLTHIVDVYGINSERRTYIDGDYSDLRGKRGNYNFDWAAISAYAIAVSREVTLYNVMEDPEEKVNLYDELPEVVQIMSGRLTDLYREVGDVIVYTSDPNGDPDLYGGIWSPGWC